MKIIVCIDKKQGMMFNNRRQSQDSAVREKVHSFAESSTVWMSNYSFRQFTDGGNFSVDDDYLNKAGNDDYCFIEDGEYDINRCDTIIVYKWNRQYQADKFFDFDFKSSIFKRISKLDFVGSSHEKITEEIFERK